MPSSVPANMSAGVTESIATAFTGVAGIPVPGVQVMPPSVLRYIPADVPATTIEEGMAEYARLYTAISESPACTHG